MNIFPPQKAKPASPEVNIHPKAEGKKMQCCLCNSSLYCYLQFYNHLLDHLQFPPYQCKTCLVSFFSDEALDYHFKYVHKVTETKTLPSESDAHLNDLNKLKKLFKTHVPSENEFQCPLCPLYFSKSEKLQYHHRNVHFDTCKSIQKNSKQKRFSYDAAFKLKVIEFAVINGNRCAGRKFNISEKCVRDWRKSKYTLMSISKTKRACRSGVSPFIKLEKDLLTWLINLQSNGLKVTRNEIRDEALKLFRNRKSNDQIETPFIASEGWCTRFLNRNKLALRTKKI